jgi:hypothetical protein
MAVSPYELEQNFNHELDLFEDQIDEDLRKFTIHKDEYVIVPPPLKMKETHFNLLKERYWSVGWRSVEYISDQRDGSYLKFTY